MRTNAKIKEYSVLGFVIINLLDSFEHKNSFIS